MSKNLKILINYSLYFISFFIICIIGASNVFAIQYTDIGYVHNLSGVNGEVTIDVTYETESGAPLVINRNQVVYTQVKVMNVFINNYSFEANRQYQLEMEFPNELLNYSNSYQVFGANNELCTVSYTNSSFTNQWPRWNWSCPTATSSIYLRVYNSNNTAISNMGNWSWSYMFLRYTNESINSDTQNTDTIINNANQNADRIIDSQNQNTQDIINSNKSCTNFDKSNVILSGYNFNENGEIISNQWFGITDFINLLSSSEIKILRYARYNNRICFYNSSKELISCYNTNGLEEGTIVPIPNGSYYIKFAVELAENRPVLQICSNGNEALNDSIDKLDDTLKDDSVDENGVSDAFESFNDYLDDNSTITQLITLPITLYTAILNNLNGTCQSFNLGKLYGEDLILPCINISQYLGNSLWTMIDIIISGFAVYAISKKMIKVFNNFSSLREGDVIDD